VKILLLHEQASPRSFSEIAVNIPEVRQLAGIACREYLSAVFGVFLKKNTKKF